MPFFILKSLSKLRYNFDPKRSIAQEADLK